MQGTYSLFITDPLKSLDADHDIVDDAEDINGTTPFQQDWTNYIYLEIDMYSNYLK